MQESRQSPARSAATRQLHESLRRLGTDCLDLVQHHEILRFEDPDRVFHPEGAQAALEAARKAGKLRFIGFTGHKDPRVHLHMLDVAKARGYRFDTVQMPLNLMDAHFRSFGRLVLPRLVRERIGVLGMKPIANGIILKSKTVSAVDCLRYALTLPTSVVITGIDSMRVLHQALAVAESFTPLSTAARRALLAKTAHAARAGAFEPFKTSSIFDARQPQSLGQTQAPAGRCRTRVAEPAAGLPARSGDRYNAHHGPATAISSREDATMGWRDHDSNCPRRPDAHAGSLGCRRRAGDKGAGHIEIDGALLGGGLLVLPTAISLPRGYVIDAAGTANVSRTIGLEGDFAWALGRSPSA